MAEKEKPAPPAGDAPAPPAAKSQLPIFIAVLVLVPVICYAMVEFLFMPRLLQAAGVVAEAKAAATSAAQGGKKTGKEVTLDFGKTMVSLAGSGGNRYLRTNIVLGSNDPELPNLVAKNDVALRDAVITVMSALTLNDVEGGDGREVVRRALMSRINGILGGDIISQIYFTEFVIQ